MIYIISVILLSCIVYSRREPLPDQRDEEFSRIKHYELVSFNDTELIETNNKLEFDVFGQHYEIELIRNDDFHVANIRHPSIDNKLHEHFTEKQLKQSCHYNGKVINANEPSTTQVSLSFCDNAGIRGRIVAFGEEIHINPSAYFLDKEKDSKYEHKLDDEHLVYKFSDFDITDIPQDVSVNPEERGNYNSQKNQLKKTVNMDRRRLAYNGGSNTVELLMVIAQDRTQNFQSTYGSNWYQTLYNEIVSKVSAVSREYASTSWGSNIGSIDVKFVELEAIQSYSGIYASLSPASGGGNTIDGGGLLNKFADWIIAHKDDSKFDNAHLTTDRPFASGSGYGYIGGMCRGDISSGVGFMGYGPSYNIRILAHEMGHNFGMNHDKPDENGCQVNDGIMGYGSGNNFSPCSIQEANTNFNNNGGLTCLGRDTHGAFSSNVGGSTPTPPTGPCPGYSKVGISGTTNTGYGDFNGCWSPSTTCHNGQYYYTSSRVSGKYLHYSSRYNRWLIGNSLGGTGVFAYATTQSTDVKTATGSWTKYSGSWQWDLGAVFADDCSGCSGSSGCLGPCDSSYDNICITRDSDLDINETAEYNYNKLWNGNKTFEHTGSCTSSDIGEKPIYEYSTFSNIDIGDDDLLNTTVSITNSVYYLHYYDRAKKFSDSNETYGEWIISQNERSTNAVARCEEEDLYNCIKGSWIIEDVSGDSLMLVIDEFMDVQNNKCGYVEEDDETNGSGMKIMIIIVVIGVIICGIGVYLWYRRQNKQMQSYADQTNTEKDMEMRQELSPKNKEGGIITTEEQEIVVEVETHI